MHAGWDQLIWNMLNVSSLSPPIYLESNRVYCYNGWQQLVTLTNNTKQPKGCKVKHLLQNSLWSKHAIRAEGVVCLARESLTDGRLVKPTGRAAIIEPVKFFSDDLGVISPARKFISFHISKSLAWLVMWSQLHVRQSVFYLMIGIRSIKGAKLNILSKGL